MKDRNEKRYFRPMLEELESRLTPSVVGLPNDSAHAVSPAPTNHAAISPPSTASNSQAEATSNAAPQVNVPGNVVGSIDFAPLGTIANDYEIKITIKAGGNVTYTQEFDIGGGTTPATVALLVYNAIPKAVPGQTTGFYTQMEGTGISIGNYRNNQGKQTTLQSITISTKGTGGATPSKSMSKQSPAPSPPPAPSPSPSLSPGSISHTSASTVSVGSLGFTFGPNTIDGTGILSAATTLTLSIDGYQLSPVIPAGTSYSQVATDVYDDLVADGLSSVSLNGNTVFVTTDFSGQPVNSISIQDTASGGADTLDVGVSAGQSV